MTATLMGRLFVVPALVVVVLLAVAVVVILFGASPIEKPRSISELINTIESDSGDRSLGNMVLSPKSKQAWQAAQELAIRFEKGRLDGQSPEALADRLVKLVRDRRASAAEAPAGSDAKETGVALQQFLILAVAKLKTPSGLSATVDLLHDPDPQIRRIALQAIADMHSMSEARSALDQMYPLLKDSSEEVRIVAALAIASVAPRGDRTAIRRIESMQAVGIDSQMNRATALTKLGSMRGKTMMLNMLSRDYWQKLGGTTQSGVATRPLSSEEISARLIALAPIAASLGDADVTGAVRKLSESDESPQVRDAARSALSSPASADSAIEADENAGAQAGLLWGESAALCA